MLIHVEGVGASVKAGRRWEITLTAVQEAGIKLPDDCIGPVAYCNVSLCIEPSAPDLWNLVDVWALTFPVVDGWYPCLTTDRDQLVCLVRDTIGAAEWQTFLNRWQKVHEATYLLLDVIHS